MWITILGMIISSVVSVVLSDRIISSLDRLFVQLRIYKSSNINGVWKSIFVIGHGKDKGETFAFKRSIIR